ncbi:alpha/beta fold hydrolase [Oceanisphaera avium]|uniref:Alpha/beta hydrolase n=1 Tax=Oceanisphaera avium TaxID=1903694 RepID=A0A1Y0CX99_9GAMM|nr:alpha/beta hydrolase [Oceanisphaera avium]ART79516.1 alpha/beta hydrolase [Oceanisphaera avium]
MTVAYKDWQFKRHGRVLAVREWGPATGAPIIALHGWLDNVASFSLLARNLSRVRLIALDFAGHGFSDHLSGGQSYYSWDHVADVYALLDVLALKRVALLGHSLGAGVASLLAGAFPTRISHLFLIDGLVPLTYPEDDLPTLMAKALRRNARLSGRSLKPYDSFDQAVAVRINSRWPVNEEAAIHLLERGLRRTEQGWVWRSDIALTQPSLVRMSEAQLRTFLQHLTMPVLLVMAKGGEELALIAPLLNEIADLTLHTLIGSHHLHLEHEPAKLISAWINERLVEA